MAMGGQKCLGTSGIDFFSKVMFKVAFLDSAYLPDTEEMLSS